MDVVGRKWSLEVEALDMPLAERFTIARESWDVAENVLVRVGRDGITGLGEAAPDGRSGESPRSVMDQLRTVDLDRLGSPFDLDGVLDLLPPGAARCALDIALHDLAGKLAGLRVCDLLGIGGRALPPSSITAPIASLDAMVDRARRLADHPILKMKVGFDGDVEVLTAIREVYPGKIRLDANEGWTVDQAIERLGRMRAFDIELCEQPIPAGDHDGLARVTEASPIPVFADEDARTAIDVVALAGRVDGVNLKLRKCGGIRETLRAIAVARAHGMKLMLGCDLESGIASTAGAHVAALVDHADLDGPLLLKRDPFPGVAFDAGRLTLPDGPGLGIDA